MQSFFQTETAIVGAGIVGLAMAYHAAKAGRRVTVFERNERAVGATIRNFGMVWPIGQPAGPALDRALRSRQIWLEITDAAGCWRSEKGSLHLAYHQDEWEVLQEFYEGTRQEAYDCELLSPEKCLELSHVARPEDLIGALYSRTEIIVEPREVPSKLARWLAERYKVDFQFGSAVTHVSGHSFFAGKKEWKFDELYVCCGDDLETLFPDTFANSPLVKCRLQMMRTAPQPGGWRMGPAIAGGLSLGHYASFSHCHSLEALKKRIEEESPWFNEWGIHVMMSQNGRGELVIGDSHEYGKVFEPFLKEKINNYIFDYLKNMIQAPDLSIAERWFGTYSKSPGATEYVAHPQGDVTLVTGLSGAGMTLSFGLAEEVIHKRLVEKSI